MAEANGLAQLLMRRKWQIQELKLKRTVMKNGDKGADKTRRRLVRKCEFPERERADEMVDYLSSKECIEYLRLCGKELNQAAGTEGLSWEPIQAWYSEEDATSASARKGMLYQVLKVVGDTVDDEAEGPYVTQDGCKYQEEYTFYWDVNEPPGVPEGRSGEHYELDIKRREDEDGLGGLYDCILVKRTTVEQDVGAYESHKELGETRITAQMLGVSDDSDLKPEGDTTGQTPAPVSEDGTTSPSTDSTPKSLDEKIATFAKEQGLKTEDGKVEDGDNAYGVVVDITKEKNADCTTSITIHNTREETVVDKRVVETETAFATTTQKETRFAKGAATLYAAGDEFAAGTITKVVNEKTQGGMVNTTVETIVAKQSVSDGKTMSESAEEVSTTYRTRNVVNPTTVDDFGGTAGSGGYTHSRTERLNEDGTYDIEETVVQEKAVPKQTVSAEVTARYIKTVTVDENVAATSGEEYELNPDGTPKAGEDGNKVPSKYPQVSVGADGTVTKKTVSKTKGGLRTIQTETTTPIALADGESTQVCERTMFEHVDVKVKEAQSDPEGEQTTDPTDKTYKKIQSTLRDDGLWDVQTTTTEELEAADAIVHRTVSGSVVAIETLEKNGNVPNSLDADKTAPTGEGFQTDHATTDTVYTLNPGGSYDARVTTRYPKKAEAIITFDPVVRKRYKTTETLFIFENYTQTDMASAKTGYQRGSARLNEFGLYDGSFSKEDTAERSSDDDPNFGKDDPEAFWDATVRHSVSVSSMMNNIWELTESWVDIRGTVEAKPKEIIASLVKAQSLTFSEVGRDKKKYAVRAESPHWFDYKSLLNSATERVGTEYKGSDFPDPSKTTQDDQDDPKE